jgi:hypothetical protein
MVTIHPAAHKIKLHADDWNHIASGRMSKISKEAQNEIASAIASTMDSDNRSLDIKDVVAVAKKKSLLQLEAGLANLLKGRGVDRNPEGQRKIDMNTDFFRKPKTYRGQHPDHRLIVKYFDHYSRALPDDARATIMHDANLGEYGSAQRKLARRHDRLPAGLDGLKFGDYQIETIKMMAEDGVFKSFFLKARWGESLEQEMKRRGMSGGSYYDDSDNDEYNTSGGGGETQEIWNMPYFLETYNGLDIKQESARKKFFEDIAKNNPQGLKTFLDGLSTLGQFDPSFQFKTPEGWERNAENPKGGYFHTFKQHEAESEQQIASALGQDLGEKDPSAEELRSIYGVDVNDPNARRDVESQTGEEFEQSETPEVELTPEQASRKARRKYRTVGDLTSVPVQDFNTYAEFGKEKRIGVPDDEQQKQFAMDISKQTDGSYDFERIHKILEGLGWTQGEIEDGQRSLGHPEESLDEAMERLEKIGFISPDDDIIKKYEMTEQRLKQEGWSQEELEAGTRIGPEVEGDAPSLDDKQGTRFERLRHAISRPITVDGNGDYVTDKSRHEHGSLKDANGEWTAAARQIARIVFPNLFVDGQFQPEGKTDNRAHIDYLGRILPTNKQGDPDFGMQHRDGMARYEFFRDHLNKYGKISAGDTASVATWAKLMESILNRPLSTQDMSMIDELADISYAHARYLGFAHRAADGSVKKVAGDANAFERLNFQRSRAKALEKRSQVMGERNARLSQIIKEFFPTAKLRQSVALDAGASDEEQKAVEDKMQEELKERLAVTEKRIKFISSRPDLWGILGIRKDESNPSKPNEQDLVKVASQSAYEDKKLAKKMYLAKYGEEYDAPIAEQEAVEGLGPDYQPRIRGQKIGTQTSDDGEKAPVFDNGYYSIDPRRDTLYSEARTDIARREIHPGTRGHHRLMAEGWTPEEIAAKRRDRAEDGSIKPSYNGPGLNDDDEIDRIMGLAADQGIMPWDSSPEAEKARARIFWRNGWSNEEMETGRRLVGRNVDILRALGYKDDKIEQIINHANANNNKYEGAPDLDPAHAKKLDSLGRESFIEAQDRMNTGKFWTEPKQSLGTEDWEKEWQSATHVTPVQTILGPSNRQDIHEFKLLSKYDEELKNLLYDPRIVGENSRYAVRAAKQDGKEMTSDELQEYLDPIVADIWEHLDKTKGKGIINPVINKSINWETASFQEKHKLVMDEIKALMMKKRREVEDASADAGRRPGRALSSLKEEQKIKGQAQSEIRNIAERLQGSSSSSSKAAGDALLAALASRDPNKVRDVLTAKDEKTGLPLIRNNEILKILHQKAKIWDMGRVGLDTSDYEDAAFGQVPLNKEQFKRWAADDLARMGTVRSTQAIGEARVTLSQLKDKNGDKIYTAKQIGDILDHVRNTGRTEGAPHLDPAHAGAFHTSVIQNMFKRYLYKIDENGDVLMQKDANGELLRDKDGNPIPEDRYTPKQVQDAAAWSKDEGGVVDSDTAKENAEIERWAATKEAHTKRQKSIAQFQKFITDFESDPVGTARSPELAQKMEEVLKNIQTAGGDSPVKREQVLRLSRLAQPVTEEEAQEALKTYPQQIKSYKQATEFVRGKRFIDHIKGSIDKSRSEEINALWNNLIGEGGTGESGIWRGIVRGGLKFMPRAKTLDASAPSLPGQEDFDQREKMTTGILAALASKGGMPVRQVTRTDSKGRVIHSFEDYAEPTEEYDDSGKKVPSYWNSLLENISLNRDVHHTARDNLFKIAPIPRSKTDTEPHPIYAEIGNMAQLAIDKDDKGNFTLSTGKKITMADIEKILKDAEKFINLAQKKAQQTNTPFQEQWAMRLVQSIKQNFDAAIKQHNLDPKYFSNEIAQKIGEALHKDKTSAQTFIESLKNPKDAVKDLYAQEQNGKMYRLKVAPWQSRTYDSTSRSSELWTDQDDKEFDKWWDGLSPAEQEREHSHAAWNHLSESQIKRLTRDFIDRTDLHGESIIHPKTGETLPPLASRIEDMRDRRDRGLETASEEEAEARERQVSLGGNLRQATGSETLANFDPALRVKRRGFSAPSISDDPNAIAEGLSSMEEEGSRAESAGGDTNASENRQSRGAASLWYTLGHHNFANPTHRLAWALRGLALRSRGEDGVREGRTATGGARTILDPRYAILPHGRNLTISGGHAGNQRIIEALKAQGIKNPERVAASLDTDYAIAHPGEDRDGWSDRSLLLAHALHSLGELSAQGRMIINRDGDPGARGRFSGSSPAKKVLSDGMTAAVKGGLTGDYGLLGEGLRKLAQRGDFFPDDTASGSVWPSDAHGNKLTIANLVLGNMHPELQRLYTDMSKRVTVDTRSKGGKQLIGSDGKVVQEKDKTGNMVPVAATPESYVKYVILPKLRELHQRGELHIDPELKGHVDKMFATLDRHRADLHADLGTTPHEAAHTYLKEGETASIQDRGLALQHVRRALRGSATPAPAITPAGAAKPSAPTIPPTTIRRDGGSVSTPPAAPAPTRPAAAAPSAPEPARPAAAPAPKVDAEVAAGAAGALRSQPDAAKSFAAFAPKPFPFSWRIGA